LWWESHADRDGDSYSHGYNDGYGYGNRYADSYCGTASNSDTASTANTSASPVGR